MNVDYLNRRGASPLRVFFDSNRAERSSAYPEQYLFRVDIDSRLDMHDIFMQIRRIQCSFTWANIEEGANQIVLGGDTMQVTPGNYNIHEIVSALNKLSWTVPTVWSWDAASGKIQVATETEVAWGAESTLAKRLGFVAPETRVASTFFQGDVLPDLSRIKCLNFHVHSMSGQSFAVYDTFEGFQLAATIFVGNAAPYTALSTTDETLFAESSMETYLNSIIVRILDQDGNPVDLQNGSFQMISEFSFHPKRNFRLEI